MNHHLLLFWLLLSHYIPIIVSFCPHICCIKPWYMWSYHPSHNGNPRNMQTTSYEPPVFYGKLHQFSHGTARHLGYVGICWDAGQLWAESPIEHGELPPRSSPVPASCFSGSGFSEDFSGDLRTRRRSQVNVDVVWLVSPLQKGWGYYLLYMIRQ